MKKKQYMILKRFFDIVIALMGIVLLVPIYIIIAPLIKWETKGNVIYKQKRIGKDGNTIIIYKFRTMIDKADEKISELPKKLQTEYEQNYKIEKDPRITKIGKFLRNTNIDEMPQAINVLKGEMSIIGIRPILKEELMKYKKEDRDKILKIKPGISGYWQVNKDKCHNYEDRMKMELYYAQNRNLHLDLKIFIKTIRNLAKDVITNTGNF